METVERYIYAVTHNLPEKARLDVELELRGLIEDLLETRTQGKAPSPDDVDRTLVELGDPAELAKEYGGKQRYLIGPGLFDSYLKVLRIVGAVALTLVGVGSVIKAFITPPDIVTFIVQFFGSFIGASFQVFAWVTLAFAAAQYFREDDLQGMAKKEWTPADLEPIPDRARQIATGEPLVSMGFAILFLALYLTPQRLGVIQIAAGSVPTVIPIIDPVMVPRFLPLFIGLIGTTIVKEGWKLVKRVWTAELAVVTLICNIVAVALSYLLFANPAFWNPDFVNQLLQANTSSGAEILSTIWPIFRKGFIYVIVVAHVVDTITALYRGLWIKSSAS